MILRKDGARTKSILLSSAAKVFAKYGYHDATNEMICKSCGLNPASVSYYYGGKEKLYRAAWSYAYELGFSEYPFDGGVPADAPAEDRLLGRIRTVLFLSSDPRYYCGQMILHELSNPTMILSDLWDAHVIRARRFLDSIVNDLLGGLACQEEIVRYGICITSMCRISLKTEPGRIIVEEYDFTMESMVKNIHNIAMAALNARRAELEAERAKKMPGEGEA